jgi:hypothetical protein
MFDNITILKTANKDSLIDVGLIAESMLFYDHVHLLFAGGNLGSLLKDIGAENFDQLLARPEIRASFWNENFGTISNANGGLRTHNFGVFEIGAKKGKFKPEEVIERTIERSIGKSFATRKRVKSVVSRLSFPRIGDTIPVDQFVEGARLDLTNPSFLQNAIEIALRDSLPSIQIPKRWHFEVMRLSDGSFAVDTDLDFAAINIEHHKLVPPEHSSITPERLLTFIFDAHAGSFFASRYMSELVQDPLCASIMKLKYVGLLQKREAAVQEIDLFQDLHLRGARTVREVINSGERTLPEFFELLDSARKFKEWLRDKNPDERLLNEYFDAVTRDTWLDKLPTKGARWIITTGLAAAVEAFYPTGAAMIAAQGISLADATLLDKILKGWRPNQFVNGQLSDFVRREGSP